MHPTSSTASLVRVAVGAVLVAFCAEGTFGLLNELLHLAVDKRPLTPLVTALGIPTGLGLFVLWLASWASPWVPRRLLWPVMGFLFWTAIGGMPLPLWLGLSGATTALWAAQAAVGAAAVALLALNNPDRRPWVPRDWQGERAFSLPRLLGAVALHLLVFTPLALGAFVLSAKASLHHLTHGFVEVGDDLTLVSRTYVKDDHTVILQAMMHVGEQAAYEAIFDSFPEGCVVLAEGVSDKRKVWATRLSYAKGARKAGLVAQTSVPWPGDRCTIHAADIDVSDFSETTRGLLDAATALWDADTTEEALTAWSKAEAASRDPDVIDEVIDDILHDRNQHLIGEIDAALAEHAVVVVPWGALHLPEIEEAVLARGFTRTGEHRQRLFDVRAVLTSLSRLAGR